MFPLRDDAPRGAFPFVTLLLICVNSLVFAYQFSLWMSSPAAADGFVETFGAIPMRATAAMAGHYPLLEGVGPLFTSIFLHGGPLHLVGNMWFLWIFGDNVEDRLGHGLFLVFYILSGLAATFAQLALNTDSTIPNVGASGAIAGVLGAYLVMFPRGRVRVLMGRMIVPMSALIVIGFWFLLQLFSQISVFTASSQTEGGGVAYMAHIGGFIAGVILTYLLGGNRRALPSSTSYRR
jgi:membrane associated rhomboid family serine protease